MTSAEEVKEAVLKKKYDSECRDMSKLRVYFSAFALSGFRRRERELIFVYRKVHLV